MSNVETQVNEDSACSFCEKKRYDVMHLIAGKNGAFICDDCVMISATLIMEEERKKMTAEVAARKKGPSVDALALAAAGSDPVKNFLQGVIASAEMVLKGMDAVTVPDHGDHEEIGRGNAGEETV